MISLSAVSRLSKDSIPPEKPFAVLLLSTNIRYIRTHQQWSMAATTALLADATAADGSNDLSWSTRAEGSLTDTILDTVAAK